MFTGHFEVIYRFVTQYYLFTQQQINVDHFMDMVKRSALEDEMKQVVVAHFMAARTGVIEDGEFRWAIMQLRMQTKTDLMTDALVDTMDLLLQGKSVNGKFLSGYEAATALIQNKIGEIEHIDNEGPNVIHMRRDVSRILDAYVKRKHGVSDYIPTGFSDIDDPTSGGYAPGDLVFYAAYTSEGKSTLAMGNVEDWVFRRKLNVAVGTAESSPEVYQRRLVSMRSADRKYGFEKPLPYKAIKEGRLTSVQERQLEAVVQDINTCPDYGELKIFKIPSRAKGGYVFGILNGLNQIFKLDAFVWDYIGYSHSDSMWKEKRHDMDQLIQDTKTNTQNFDNGRGIVTLSPFQVSRGKWEQALKDGKYTLACMAESSEAEKAADIVLSVLRTETGTRAQLLKTRDAITRGQTFDLDFDEDIMRYKNKVKIGVA